MSEVPMADVETDESNAERSGILDRIAFAAGAAGLLAAMATDTIAVAGRHIGINLLGSIEMVQACVVFTATASMIFATLHSTHARVHILFEHVSAATVRLLDRVADFTSAILFVWFAAGSAWIAHDLWNGVEVTELLQLPLRWLRVIWIAGSLVIAALFALSFVRGKDHAA